MMRNRKGFTLLEIMIVVIIVGVLAALALPRLFSTVEYSRITEAWSAITSIRSSMERCYLDTQSYVGCDDIATELDLEDPADSPGAHFTYAITSNAGNIGNFLIVATRNTVDSGDINSDVGLYQNGTAIGKCGDGAFAKAGGGVACAAALTN